MICCSVHKSTIRSLADSSRFKTVKVPGLRETTVTILHSMTDTSSKSLWWRVICQRSCCCHCLAPQQCPSVQNLRMVAVHAYRPVTGIFQCPHKKTKSKRSQQRERDRDPTSFHSLMYNLILFWDTTEKINNKKITIMSWISDPATSPDIWNSLSPNLHAPFSSETQSFESLPRTLSFPRKSSRRL